MPILACVGSWSRSSSYIGLWRGRGGRGRVRRRRFRSTLGFTFLGTFLHLLGIGEGPHSVLAHLIHETVNLLLLDIGSRSVGCSHISFLSFSLLFSELFEILLDRGLVLREFAIVDEMAFLATIETVDLTEIPNGSRSGGLGEISFVQDGLRDVPRVCLLEPAVLIGCPCH